MLNCGNAGTCNGGNQVDVYAWALEKSQQTGTGIAYDTENPYIACSGGNPHIDGRTSEGFCASRAAIDGTKCTAENTARVCPTFGAECTALNRYPNATISAYGTVSGERDIMEEIYHNGPVACSADADPMVDYEGGVLTEQTRDPIVNHVISIVGWGEADGHRYWHVRNSWGESWGEAGFARIRTGLMALEDECAWADVGTFTAHDNVPCHEDGANCDSSGRRRTTPGPYAYGVRRDDDEAIADAAAADAADAAAADTPVHRARAVDKAERLGRQVLDAPGAALG